MNAPTAFTTGAAIGIAAFSTIAFLTLTAIYALEPDETHP